MPLNHRFFCQFLVGLLTLFLVGCATIPEGQVRSKADPWEALNRNVYVFNTNLDDYVVRPLTKVYEFAVPEIVRSRFSNVFANVGDVFTAVQQLLQGKPKTALDDLIRVFVNTTIGLGGIFDVATEAGLEKHKEDFGQTFGVWGIPSGPYVVLPILGPSSLRDAFGWVADLNTDILINQIDNVPVRNIVSGVRIVDQRLKYLNASGLLAGVAFDQYSFVRDAYLQRRRFLIYDGEPPLIDDYDAQNNRMQYLGEEKRMR
ncbi:MAG: VacJ family lipoprotein [Polynucleobacter sp.]|nr:VacJ family lipoprotein [Polynucleobacter sp.]